MELSEQAAAILAAILNVPVSKVKEYAEAEDAEQQIKDLNAANLKKKFDEGHKKASKITSKNLIEAIKAEFDIDLSGETPQELAVSLKESLSDRDADDISEETIKASSAYKSLLAEKTRTEQEVNKQVEKKVKEQVKEKEAEFQKTIKQVKKSSLLTEVEREAEKWLEKEGAILSADPERRMKQIKEFAKKVDAYDLDKDEDGNFLISKADGTPATNKDEHNASLSDIFRENDYLFNFKTVEERKSSGLNPNGGGNSSSKKFEHWKGEVPKTKAELDAIELKYVMKDKDAPTRDALKEVQAAYAEQQKN